MRKLFWIAMLVGIAVATGCATVAETPQEHMATYKSVVDLDMRQIADDWSLIWLDDRQGRLTRWLTR